jgi:hypothetical protein
MIVNHGLNQGWKALKNTLLRKGMAELIGLLGGVAGIGSLVCLIIVLTKLFPAEGVLKGIFGIICGIYTFIWGWQNVDRYNLKNIMTIWSACFVVSIITRVLALSAAKG